MEFKKIILENCVNDIIDYRGKTPKKLKGEWNEKGTFRAVSAKNIKNMQLVNLESLKKVDNELYKKWMKKEVSKNDILLTSEAPLGESLFWDSDEKIVLSQRVFGLKPNTDIVNPKYLFAYLQTPKFKHELTSRESGTTVTGIRRKELEKTIIEVPSQNIQKFIGDLFYITNKKIKNNQNIIANLEEISQTLFKRWFVDFEFPDENGNPYKSSGGEMVDSELGEIPERWEIVKLKDIVYQKKDTFNPQKSNELKVLHFSLPAFDSSQNPVIDDVNAIKSNKWIIDENCILFSKMNPSTRRIWLTSNDGKYLNVASSEFVVLKSDNSYKNAFIYNICTSDKFSEFLNSNTTGSTNSRQRVKPDIAISYKLAFHNETSMLFSNKVEPYLEKIKVIRNENQKLAELRDTLLPKLMSGEIEIPDDIEVNEDELSI